MAYEIYIIPKGLPAPIDFDSLREGEHVPKLSFDNGDVNGIVVRCEKDDSAAKVFGGCLGKRAEDEEGKEYLVPVNKLVNDKFYIGEATPDEIYCMPYIDDEGTFCALAFRHVRLRYKQNSTQC